MAAPYEHRDPNLRASVRGVVFGGSIEGALPRINLHGLAHWREDRPGGTDGRRDYAAAVEARWGLGEVATAETADTMGWIARVYDNTTHRFATFEELESTTAMLSEAIQQGGPIPTAALREGLTLFTRMAGIASEVWHGALDPDLVDNLWTPLDRVRADGEHAMWRMAELRERLGGRSFEEQAARANAAQADAEARPYDYTGLGDGLWAFAATVSSASALDEGPDALLFYEPPERCVAGATVGWRPFPGADWVAVAGLPGARVEGDEITWFARHGGQYRAAVAATSGEPATWDTRLVELTCEIEQL